MVPIRSLNIHCTFPAGIPLFVWKRRVYPAAAVSGTKKGGAPTVHPHGCFLYLPRNYRWERCVSPHFAPPKPSRTNPLFTASGDCHPCTLRRGDDRSSARRRSRSLTFFSGQVAAATFPPVHPVPPQPSVTAGFSPPNLHAQMHRLLPPPPRQQRSKNQCHTVVQC